jgi:multidrug efflux pump subunit AcrB
MLRYLTNRPLAVITVFVAFLALGLYAYFRLPTALMPAVEVPRLRVTVAYPQGNPAFIEQSILKPLRTVLSGVYGLKSLESTSATGLGQIDLSLAYGSQVKLAFLEVNEKIDQVMPLMPADMPRPLVFQNNPTDIPVVRLQMQAENLPELEQADLARFVVKRRLEQLPGVSLVEMNGAASRQIRVVPDEAKMLALGIRHSGLVQAIRAANLSLRQIEVRDGIYSYDIGIPSLLHHAEGVGSIEVQVKGTTVPIRELAQVGVAMAERTGVHLLDGQEAIVFAVHSKPTYKSSEVMKGIEATVTDLRGLYPGVTFTLTQDQNQLLSSTVNQLVGSLLAGGAVAFVILFLFSGEWKSPILMGVLVPTSLAITFLLLWVFGLTINLITLSGLILGIGILIDNGIIILDNIQSKLEQRGLLDACVLGVTEVAPAMVSSLLTTLCVFLPLLFMEGLAGVLFRDQIIALALVLTASLLVSFFLLPVLFGRLTHKAEKRHSRFFLKILKGYQRSRNRSHWILRSLVGILLLGMGVAVVMPKQNLPDLSVPERELHVYWSGPVRPQANASLTKALTNGLTGLEQWEAEIGTTELLEEGMNVPFQSRVYLRFKTPTLASQGAHELIRRLQSVDSAAYWQIGRPKNPYDQLLRQSGQFARLKLRRTDQGFLHLDSIPKSLLEQAHAGLGFQVQPALKLDLHNDRIDLYKLDRTGLIDRIATELNDQRVTIVNRMNEALPISVMGSGNLKSLETLQLFGQDSVAYPLSQFFKISESSEARFITSDLAGPYQDLTYPKRDTHWPGWKAGMDSLVQARGWMMGLDGDITEQGRNFWSMLLAMLMAILLLYVILVAQFESFKAPLVILSEIPVAVSGSLLLLYGTGGSLNISSLMGILITLGIIVNDSILKLDTILRLERSGLARAEAINRAGTERLKPILLTTLTTLLALIPVLFAGGYGGGLQEPLVLAMLGGLTVGTLCSVYLMPWVYARI